MCNTLAPFSKTTFPSLIVCLCLAYCRLFKLTAASNAGRISPWSPKPQSSLRYTATHLWSHADHRWYCRNAQKCYTVLLIWTTLGAIPPRILHFWKVLVELMLSSNWHVTLRLTVFEIFAGYMAKIWHFGSIGGGVPPPITPKKIMQGPICSIMQNLTPIGGTVTDISDRTKQEAQLSQRNRAMPRVVEYFG